MRANVILSGQLEIIHKGPDGKIKHHEKFCNLVVSSGRTHIIDRLGPVSQAAMSHMAVGNGLLVAELADISLSGELHRNALTSVTIGVGAEANRITYIADFAPGEGTGEISEAGIFNSASAGTMLCRVAFAPRPKEAGDAVRHIWVLTISS